MNAGMPGTGLGGLFYIAGALWMPMDAVWRRSTGRSTKLPWRILGRQVMIASGILGSLWATGWGLGFLVFLLAEGSGAAGTISASGEVSSVVRWTLLLGSVALLLAVLTSVEVLRLALPARGRPAAGRARVRYRAEAAHGVKLDNHGPSIIELV